MVEIDEQDIENSDNGGGVPWWALGCAGLTLVFFVGVGIVVFPVVAALLFPPEPPLPAGAVEQRHESAAYGFDTWEYALSVGDGCEAVTFYEANGGTCVLEAGHCGAEGDKRSALAGTCTGVTTFSRFAMRWDVEVWDYPAGAELVVERETAWTR